MERKLSENEIMGLVCRGLTEISKHLSEEAKDKRDKKRFLKHAEIFDNFAYFYSKQQKINLNDECDGYIKKELRKKDSPLRLAYDRCKAIERISKKKGA